MSAEAVSGVVTTPGTAPVSEWTPLEQSVCAIIRRFTSAAPTHSWDVARAVGASNRRVRQAVESAVRKGALIGSVSLGRHGIQAGWFWIQTEAELDAACADLQARAAAIQTRALALMCAWQARPDSPTAQLALL